MLSTIIAAISSLAISAQGVCTISGSIADTQLDNGKKIKKVSLICTNEFDQACDNAFRRSHFLNSIFHSVLTLIARNRKKIRNHKPAANGTADANQFCHTFSFLSEKGSKFIFRDRKPEEIFCFADILRCDHF